MQNTGPSEDSLREAEEVGCTGLLNGEAIQTETGIIVDAEDVSKKDGPFYCSECYTDAIHRNCHFRVNHFAHHARLSPIVRKEESALHKRCKEEICAQLKTAFPEGKWEVERPVKANSKLGTGDLRPDISGYIGGQRLVIEVQASYLTIPRILKRAESYKKLGCAILWIVPLREPLGDALFRPRLFERYLHTAYFGRTYYWTFGSGLMVQPIHFDSAIRYIEQREFHTSPDSVEVVGGYPKPYKILKIPNYGPLSSIKDDFILTKRSPFTPAGDKKEIPALLTWQDKHDRWWETKKDTP